MDTLEDIQAANEELTQKLAEARATIGTLTAENASLRTQLTGLGRKGYPPEVVALANEKIKLGLPAEDAYEVAARQVEMEKANKKEKK